MKRPTMLLRAVLSDAYMACGLTYDCRDLQTIEGRVEREGISFLTLTLPTLSDALESALERGYLVRSDFLAFQPASRSETIPALLQGMFRLVFNMDGLLKDNPCPEAIEAIRQVARLYKKVKLPCTVQRKAAAFEGYVLNESYLSGLELSFDALFDKTCAALWYGLEGLTDSVYCSFGQFGSGATAERASINERLTVRWWYDRSERSFPLSAFASHREDDVESFNSVLFFPESAEVPVRVASVPKTLKGPRIISVEPSWVMLMQQSLAKPTTAFLEGNPLYATRFTDQKVNKEMARIGSIDRSNCTIDLKDASDLVHLDLVRRVFRACPTYLQMMEDCRSRLARLPDGRTLTLNKFASMGSAMCFPVEAMVFYSIVVYSILLQSGRLPSTAAIMEIAKDVTVFGDDIIVPAKYGTGVQSALEAFGLRVNRNKTFLRGFFRESCGGDYYQGHNVTPVYIRRMYDGERRDAEDIVSLVSTANLFYEKGYWHTAQFLRQSAEDRVGPIPHSTRDMGILTHTSFFRTTECRWDSSLHTFRVKGLTVDARCREDYVATIRGGMRAFIQGEVLNDTLVTVRNAHTTTVLTSPRSDFHPASSLLWAANHHFRDNGLVSSVVVSTGLSFKEAVKRDLSHSVERDALRLKRHRALV